MLHGSSRGAAGSFFAVFFGRRCVGRAPLGSAGGGPAFAGGTPTGAPRGRSEIVSFEAAPAACAERAALTQ